MKCPECGSTRVRIFSRIEVSHFMSETENEVNQPIIEEFWNQGPITRLRCVKEDCEYEGSPEEFEFEPEPIRDLKRELSWRDLSLKRAILRGWNPKPISEVIEVWGHHLKELESQGDLAEEYMDRVLGSSPGELLQLRCALPYYINEAVDFLSYEEK